jgi:two-component system chemotaxis sensor kinase CheA
MAIDVAQFHQVFFEECFESLDVMEARLLIMEPGEPDPDEINALFRTAHSIKGGSGTFGFPEIASFTHIVEALLDEIRDGHSSVTQECLNALLGSVDVLREMLIALEEGVEYQKEKVEQHKEALIALLSEDSEIRLHPPSDPSEKQAESDVTGWKIQFRPLPHLMQSGNDPLRIIRDLAALGELDLQPDMGGLPRFAELQPEQCYLAWNMRLMGSVPRKAVEEIFAWVEDDCELVIDPIRKSPEAQERREQGGGRRGSDRRGNDRRQADRRFPLDRRRGDRRAGGAVLPGSSSMRVDLHKLNTLVDLTNELVMTQKSLGMMDEELDAEGIERLREGMARLTRQTRELQKNILQARELQISFVFGRFAHLVHDLGDEMGKKIELVTVGDELGVDKAVFEKIGDPLVHLVRNSFDHGIELPQERIAAGKPETGTIRIEAIKRPDGLLFEVQDDGRGLDRKQILNKAIAQGVVSADQKLSDKQIDELIFHPGLTTAGQVSDVSGRGVGMDVVRRNIQELGGQIDIESAQGVGSSILIRLPLTPNVMQGRVVRVGGESYVIPSASIVDAIPLQAGVIDLSAGGEGHISFGDERLSIIRLQRLFGIDTGHTGDLAHGQLLIVDGDGGRRGLLVDHLEAEVQQVVVKALEDNYQRIEGLNGAAILDDGSVALVLDISGVIRLARDLPVRVPQHIITSQEVH